MWGRVSVIGGALVAVVGLLELISGEGGDRIIGLIVYGSLAVVPILIGLHFLKSGKALEAVVTTEGDDIYHLLDSIESLGTALLFQLEAVVLWVLLMALGLVTTTAIPSFAIDLRERAYQGAARADLKDLAVAQEASHASAGAYARDLGQLDFSGRGGVRVTIVSADRDGWAATSTHRGAALLGCAIFVGNAVPPPTPVGQRPEQRGVPVCD